MKEFDQHSLRDAAVEVEAASSRVLGIIGMGDRASAQESMLPAEELAALHSIAADLRSASARMWKMLDYSPLCGGSFHLKGLLPHRGRSTGVLLAAERSTSC
jgi:hypothetical protein